MTIRMEHNFERLKAHILPLSRSKIFETARREWGLVGIEISAEFDNCPCGQEILEHCFIHNDVTGSTTFVGNVCVNRFIGIETGTLFDGLRRVRQNPAANANEALIRHAQNSGYLYEKEFDFLMDTRHKRDLSPKQIEWKKKINRRILKQTVVQRRSSEIDAMAALHARVAGVRGDLRNSDG